jgi:hypothetical protein
MRTETLHVKIKSSGFLGMSNLNNENNQTENRLSLETLRSCEMYKNMTDEEGEVILNEIIEFARMLLGIIN